MLLRHQKFSSKRTATQWNYSISSTIFPTFSCARFFFLRAFAIWMFAFKMLTLILRVCVFLFERERARARSHSQAHETKWVREGETRCFCVWCAYIRVQRKLRKNIYLQVSVCCVCCIFLFILHTRWFTIFDSTFVIGWMLFADDELKYTHSHITRVTAVLQGKPLKL